MSRLPIPSDETLPAGSKTLLETVRQTMGKVPNLYRVMGSSPAALEAFLVFSSAAGKLLDVKTRERIALATAQVNGCDYCLSAHTYIGSHLTKLGDSEIELARQGRSADARADAAVRFAKAVAEQRGQVSDADLEAVRAAGFSPAEVVEIVLIVVENLLTNFVNNVARTDVDFPHVRAQAA